MSHRRPTAYNSFLQSTTERKFVFHFSVWNRESDIVYMEIKKCPVGYAHCSEYTQAAVFPAVCALLDALSLTREQVEGKRVCIKPNLVMAQKPDGAATTHPVVLDAVARRLAEWNPADICVIDSPGGPYTAANVHAVYRSCGLEGLNEIPHTHLNEDFSFRRVSLPNGVRVQTCNMLTPVLDCDILINVCKLKTHGLTGYSGAVKNLFGLIPGVEKFEMHATFPKIEDFSDMLLDITEYIRQEKTYIALCDGIVGMEGNGPTHGTPKHADILLASRSPYALDKIGAHLIGCNAPILHLEHAAARGLTEADWEKIPLLAVNDGALPAYRFTPPEASATRFLKNLSGIFGGKLAEAFAVRPAIMKNKCVGCGVCIRSCPVHTIVLDKKGKKAQIQPGKCIRCYCCQELCPHGAVRIRKNFLIRFIH